MTAIRFFVALGLLVAVTGCIHQPTMLPLSKQTVIDRMVVEYPSGFELKPVVDGLNQPTAFAFALDGDGSMLVAESGISGAEPHIFGFHRDGSYFNIYPYKRAVTFYPTGFVMYGPIGGMVVHQGKIYISHRDRDGKGVITALGYEGQHRTVVANLPAQGDYGVTDIAINPIDGRLYYGVGTATNSGVVGVDNWYENWLKHHPDVRDLSYVDMKLNGYRFDTLDPWAGLFGGADIAVTGAFQAFNQSNQSRIPHSDTPNGAIYSAALDGDASPHVECWGLHNPRGLAFNEYGQLYFTNDGMECRGTRPVKNDPDCLLHFGRGNWYGWPDYTTDLNSVSDEFYWGPLRLLAPTGYSEVSPVIDHEASNLHIPDPRTVVAGRFPSLSGAAKLVFIPGKGPFKAYESNAIVALDGDRAPFATSGEKLNGPVGFKVVRVDTDTRQVKDFVHNTANVPASMLRFGTVGLERPIDVKLGPDGALYILDFGRMENKTGLPRFYDGTGRIFKLVPISTSTTKSF